MEIEQSMYFMHHMLSAVNAVPFLLSIATYVLTAWGLYTFAQRRMISHAWLSWVPVANLWILGSLSDQYRYVAKGQVKSKRKILLGLSIASAVAVVVLVIGVIAVVLGIISDAAFGMITEEEIFNLAAGGILGLLGGLLLLLPLVIVTAVFRYMALYDLYLSCDPENAVLFLVLSIIFSVTEPFFIFFNREKDKGMPPRRVRPEPAPAYGIPQAEYEQPRETPAEPVPEAPEAEMPQTNEAPADDSETL